jgi:hypothetical protein
MGTRMSWLFATVFGVMALGSVGCGTVPDEQEVTERSSSLTSPYAIRFWVNGLCLVRSFTMLQEKPCDFSAPSTQKWGFQADPSANGFQVWNFQDLHCLRSEQSSGTSVVSCTSGDLRESWQQPGFNSNFPNFSPFKLVNVQTQKCLTAPTGGATSPISQATCASSGPVNDRQILNLDTF